MTWMFQRHEASVERLYVEDNLQHNPGIPQGRDVLQAIVATLPNHDYYEPGLLIEEGNLVAIHGRIQGLADNPQVVVDLFRIEGGRLAEHWDVLQGEVIAAADDISMFDPGNAARVIDNL